MPKTLLLGGTGMLGTDLARVFRNAEKAGEVWAPGRAEVSFDDLEDLYRKVVEARPSLVINSVAYTNVDLAEKEPLKAQHLNADGPYTLVNACAKLGIPLVHFSTDQVLPGTEEKFQTEDTLPAPANVYARTKGEGEKAVLGYPQGLVLRVQWLYGHRKDRFTPLKTQEVFRPFSDMFGAPTWTLEIARTVQRLVAMGARGLFQFAYDDYASWADVYRVACEFLGYKTKLEPVSFLTLGLPAPRPMYSLMSNRKLCEFLGIRGMGSWKEPFVRFLSGKDRV